MTESLAKRAALVSGDGNRPRRDQGSVPGDESSRTTSTGATGPDGSGQHAVTPVDGADVARFSSPFDQ